MHTRQKLFSLLLVLLLVIAVAPAAFAEMVFSGEQESLSGEVDSTVFLVGENPTNSADVKGILFEAGNAVRSDGLSEYAFVAGNTVMFAGSNSRDAFVGGNAVSFSGDCGRDLAIAGNRVDISGSVARDLMAGGKTVVISGQVGGDVTIGAEEITITDNAEIGGKLHYNSSAKITAPTAVLAGAVVYEDGGSEEESTAGSTTVNTAENTAGSTAEDAAENTAENTAGNTAENTTENTAGSTTSIEPAPKAKSSSFLSKVKSRVFTFIGLLLIAYFFLWLTPLWEKVDADYTGKRFGTYAKAFGIGLAVLAALPLASIILMVSGVGMRPALVLLLVCIAAIIAAPVFLGFFLGSLLWRKALKKERNYWAELAIGLACWAVLISIPGVSILVRVVSSCLGVGVLTGFLGKKKKSVPAEKKASPLPETSTGLTAQNEAENAGSLLPPETSPEALKAPEKKED